MDYLYKKNKYKKKYLALKILRGGAQTLSIDKQLFFFKEYIVPQLYNVDKFDNDIINIKFDEISKGSNGIVYKYSYKGKLYAIKLNYLVSNPLYFDVAKFRILERIMKEEYTKNKILNNFCSSNIVKPICFISAIQSDENIIDSYINDTYNEINLKEDDFFYKKELRCAAIVMDYIENDFETFILNKVSLKKFIDIINDYFKGLSCLNNNGYYHGDIKPLNLRYTDTTGIIIDIGSAEQIIKINKHCINSSNYLPDIDCQKIRNKNENFDDKLKIMTKIDTYMLGISISEVALKINPDQVKTMYHNEIVHKIFTPLHKPTVTTTISELKNALSHKLKKTEIVNILMNCLADNYTERLTITDISHNLNIIVSKIEKQIIHLKNYFFKTDATYNIIIFGRTYDEQLERGGIPDLINMIETMMQFNINDTYNIYFYDMRSSNKIYYDKNVHIYDVSGDFDAIIWLYSLNIYFDVILFDHNVVKQFKVYCDLDTVLYLLKNNGCLYIRDREIEPEIDKFYHSFTDKWNVNISELKNMLKTSFILDEIEKYPLNVPDKIDKVIFTYRIRRIAFDTSN